MPSPNKYMLQLLYFIVSPLIGYCGHSNFISWGLLMILKADQINVFKDIGGHCRSKSINSEEVKV